jgi:acyl-CoA synthetase (AMP-forming)/AMP-acid ligase II
MRYAPRKYDPALIEALAINGALKPDLSDGARQKAIADVAAWLGRADTEAQWSGEMAPEGAYLLKRLWRGVTDAYIIEKSFLISAEARKLASLAQEQADVYAAPATLKTLKKGAVTEEQAPEPIEGGEDEQPAESETKGKTVPVSRPSELLEAVLAAGRKGLSIQRYKGLGEMNAEQLWETTLDRANRSLLRVEISQADVADEIFTRLMGDIVEINDGWLSVVGRTSDFIIRGGKNISAPAVEAEVGTHPQVKLAAVVPVPDPVFGERVACYVEVEPGVELTLDDIKAHLLERGVSKEWIPEHLFVTTELPRSSGSKVAKGELKADAARRVAIP